MASSAGNAHNDDSEKDVVDQVAFGRRSSRDWLSCVLILLLPTPDAQQRALMGRAKSRTKPTPEHCMRMR